MAQLFNAYLDESGTHGGSKVVVVAGFISNVSKWEAFSKKWKEALDTWGIDRFHMTDFESRKKQFASWTDQAERQERLNHLLGLIKQHTFQSVGFAVPKEAFDRILSDKAKSLCGDAYGLAAVGCWWTAAKLASEPMNDGYINFVMDGGSRGAIALLRIYNSGMKVPQWRLDTRIIGLSFQDNRRFPPLQAADILAYELYKHLPRQLSKDKQWPDRYPLRELRVPGRSHWHYADDDELRIANEHLTQFQERLESGAEWV